METIEQIKSEVMRNESIIKMYSGAQCVFGYGSGSNGIMIIGEAPSRSGGNITGEPFTSPYSGKLVQEILDENGIKKGECFITNICFCSPPENQVPGFREITLCLPYILKIIQIIKPRIVIALGNLPAQYLLPQGYQRGKYYNINGIDYVGMFHPAYILRTGNSALSEYKSAFEKILKDKRREQNE